MNYPADLKYSKSHEWIKLLDDTTALVGISDYAQAKLGNLVFITLPAVGDKTEVEVPFCDVESIKAVSDVYCPCAGVVAEVNEKLPDTPELLNDDPYGAWIAKIGHISAFTELLDADAYEAFTLSCEEE